MNGAIGVYAYSPDAEREKNVHNLAASILKKKSVICIAAGRDGDDVRFRNESLSMFP